jgi:hypothetical protein
MTRALAVTLTLLLTIPLAACATKRGDDSRSAPESASVASADDEPKWEPWPPPEVTRANAQRAAESEAKPSGPTVRFAAKNGGWTVAEALEEVSRATGRPILYDGSNATFKQAKIEFLAPGAAIEMPASEFFAFVQAALSYRKLCLAPVGPHLANGEQSWFVMDMADPSLKTRPVFIDESEVFAYGDRDGLYVVTTLRLRDTVDANRARNALSPLSTATAGIGRIQDMGSGGRSLIVGDFAPVVASMKRLLDRINAETSPPPAHPGPCAECAAPKAEKEKK